MKNLVEQFLKEVEKAGYKAYKTGYELENSKNLQITIKCKGNYVAPDKKDKHIFQIDLYLDYGDNKDKFNDVLEIEERLNSFIDNFSIEKQTNYAIKEEEEGEGVKIDEKAIREDMELGLKCAKKCYEIINKIKIDNNLSKPSILPWAASSLELMPLMENFIKEIKQAGYLMDYINDTWRCDCDRDDKDNTAILRSAYTSNNLWGEQQEIGYKFIKFKDEYKYVIDFDNFMIYIEKGEDFCYHPLCCIAIDELKRSIDNYIATEIDD